MPAVFDKILAAVKPVFASFSFYSWTVAQSKYKNWSQFSVWHFYKCLRGLLDARVWLLKKFTVTQATVQHFVLIRNLCMLTVVAIVWFIFALVIPMAAWLFGLVIVFGLIFTLLTGYVYFIVHTGFGRATDIDQRFWKRSFGVFWLIESSLFAVYLYLILTAPAELLFANKQHPELVSLKAAILDFIWRSDYYSVFLIVTTVALQANKNNAKEHVHFFILVLMCLFVLILITEAAAFYYFLSTTFYISWFTDEASLSAIANADAFRKRTVYGLFVLTAIIKFWHFAFVTLLWIFYLSRRFETKESREALLTAVFQSFVILYVLNALMLVPGFKEYFKTWLSKSYYWFFEIPNFNLRETVQEIVVSLFIF